MQKVTTASGAVYHVDWDAGRVMRTGPESAGIDYDAVPDDEWQNFIGASVPTVGVGMQFILSGMKLRLSTEVVLVEEVALT